MRFKPWLGVPGPIAYEGTISDWIKKEGLIKNACDFVKRESLDKPISEIANYLCETNHRMAWFKIAFPEELEEINQKYENKQKAQTIILEVLNGETSRDEMESKAETARCLTELREILSDEENSEEFDALTNPESKKDQNKIIEFVKKISKKVDLQKDEEIGKSVFELTNKLIEELKVFELDDEYELSDEDEPTSSPESAQKTNVPWGKQEKEIKK